MTSETTRRIAALLREEAERWPGVTTRPMFGMCALFHEGAIFAALPVQRAMGRDGGIGYKEDGVWQLFEVNDEGDIAKALVLLKKAYERAR